MGLLTRSVIVLILTLFLSGHALACWCLEGGGPACQEAWKTGVDAIFLGRVVKIDRIQGDLGMPAGAASRTSTGKFNRVTLEIEEVYRGDSSKTLQVLLAQTYVHRVHQEKSEVEKGNRTYRCRSDKGLEF